MNAPRTLMTSVWCKARVLTIAIASSLMSSATLPAVNEEWEPIAPLPVPNGGFAAGVESGRVVVAGGTTWKDDVKIWLDEVWAYDAAGNRWSAVGRLPFPLGYGVVAETADGLMIAGGFDGTRSRDEVVLVGADGPVKIMTQRLKRATSLAVGGVLGEGAKRSVYVFGGSTDPAKLDGVMEVGQRVPLKGVDERVMMEKVPPHFFISSGAVCGGALYVFTSAKASSATTVVNVQDCWVFRAETETGEWKALATYPMALRGVTAVRLDDTRIYVAGGYGGEPEAFRSEAYIYDTVRDVFTPAKPLPIAAMVGLVNDGTWIYCLGGEDAKKHRTDKCWRIAIRALLPPSAP